jgi:prepilin-type N-terminal cleavage/methylation domain-containing protein
VLSGLGLSAVPAQGVVPVLIFTEALLGGLFVLGIAGRRTRWATVALIALFSFGLLWMWKRPPAQGCGCVGFWTFPNHPRHEMLLGLARNIGLIMCVSVQMGDGVALARPPVGRVQPRPARRGVTVIETLCVIAVIVVLAAIILPHLAGSRRAARRVTELAGAREMYGALTMYGRDYADAFPFCATPGEIDGPLTLYGASFRGRFFTAQSKLFVNLLAPTYLSSTKELAVVDRDYNANSGMPPQVMQSEVWLTYTAFSRPSYWVGAQPPDGGTLLCGGRWSDVGSRLPKGCFWTCGLITARLPAKNPRRPWSFGGSSGETGPG